VRRRAREERRLLAKVAEAEARGEDCTLGAQHDRASDALHAERRRARMRVDPGGMPHTSNWRAEERRRLSASEEDGDEPVTVVPCADCVTWAGEVEFQLLQTFRYYDFPFDRHTIRIEYVVQGGDLFTCKDRDGLAIMGIETDKDALEKLLPSTGTWFLDGSVDQAVKLSHPIDVTTGEPKREYCVVRIHIKRNWIIYFVKQICTMLLCTSGGLLGLLMQPGELLGDRVATLLVSILILITALQADVGLGNLSYLIWVDWFNLMQLIVLLIALTQTMIVHRLDHRKMSDLLIFFDKVSRVIIPVMLYPASVIGMVLLGLHFRVLGWTVLLGGYGGSFLLGVFWVKQVYLKARVERKKVIKEVQNVKEEDCDEPEEYLKLLAKLFAKFDIDDGGEIDVREMRMLLMELHPDVPRGAISKAMLEISKFTGIDEELDLASFIDAYEAANKAIQLYVEDAIADGVISGEAASKMARTSLPSRKTLPGPLFQQALAQTDTGEPSSSGAQLDQLEA